MPRPDIEVSFPYAIAHIESGRPTVITGDPERGQRLRTLLADIVDIEPPKGRRSAQGAHSQEGIPDGLLPTNIPQRR